MGSLNSFSFCITFFLIALSLNHADAAIFHIRNNCNKTIWAAAVPAGGGKKLNNGETWNIKVPAGTTAGRVWGRTGCSFNSAGQGSCKTGDCGGRLNCTASGAPPTTLAEFTLSKSNNTDFFDISLVDGFNLPMEFVPTSRNCTRGPRCTVDVKSQCPGVLKAPGGCNSPCTVFKTDQYCCKSGKCQPTEYSKYFKGKCPDAYSYPKDDASSTFTCPRGTNYRVVFCP